MVFMLVKQTPRDFATFISWQLRNLAQGMNPYDEKYIYKLIVKKKLGKPKLKDADQVRSYLAQVFKNLTEYDCEWKKITRKQYDARRQKIKSAFDL